MIPDPRRAEVQTRQRFGTRRVVGAHLLDDPAYLFACAEQEEGLNEAG
jgi:hypothetical protein